MIFFISSLDDYQKVEIISRILKITLNYFPVCQLPLMNYQVLQPKFI